jgi:hypothetical protein
MRLITPSLLFLAACPAPEARDYSDPPTDVSARLARFGDCDEFREYLVSSYVESLVQGQGGHPVMAEDSASDGGEQAGNFSTTNVQEVGVDEPDLVKTDGSYLYVLTQGMSELVIVDAWPAEETAVVGRVDLGGYPYAMLLDGDTLAVFQWVYDSGTRGGADSTPLRSGYGTRVSFVDVSDRSAPEVTRAIDYEGYYTNARLIGHDAWVVSNSWFDMPQALWDLAYDPALGLPEYDWSASEDEQAATREEMRRKLWPEVEKVVAGMPIADLLPNWYDWDGAAWSGGDALVSCTDIYRPDGVSQPGLLNVMHLDLSDPVGTEPQTTGLFANGWTVYASLEALYISQTSYWWGWGWGQSDLTTHVHRFELDRDTPAYTGSGEVPGWQWSQFALDEEDGFLRMATTSWDWWWGGGGNEGNNVFVLETEGEDLDVVGSVTGIAPGESIQGVRFIGDIGWLVTFLQVDPLFAIDLSDPTAPTVIGELELPGFSSYIHPLEDGWLLTAGMGGTEDGSLTGFALKLFDVRDPTNPVLASEALVESDEWSYSEAMWDHHAFTLYNGVLAVPLYTWDYDDRTGDWTGFSGLWVTSVATESGITDLGRVDHADLVAGSDCIWDDMYSGGEGSTSAAPCGADYWYSGVRRSVVMEDKLYSVSDYGVKVTELRTPTDVVASARFWPL